MAIAQTDLQAWGSQTMADDDTVTNIGGAVDTTKKITFTQLTPDGMLEMVSGSALDTTQTVTVTGRVSGTGAVQSETKTLNGTTAVAFTTTWSKILKVTLSATANGIVTIRKSGGGTTICTLEVGVIQVRDIWYNVTSLTSGTVKYYEKIFLKNNHATLTLNNAAVSEVTDVYNIMAFGLAAAVNDSGTNGVGNSRKVAPAGITFDSSSKNIPGTNLAALSAIGVWLELTLTTGYNPIDDKYEIRLAGQSSA